MTFTCSKHTKTTTITNTTTTIKRKKTSMSLKAIYPMIGNHNKQTYVFLNIEIIPCISMKSCDSSICSEFCVFSSIKCLQMDSGEILWTLKTCHHVTPEQQRDLFLWGPLLGRPDTVVSLYAATKILFFHLSTLPIRIFVPHKDSLTCHCRKQDLMLKSLLAEELEVENKQLNIVFRELYVFVTVRTANSLSLLHVLISWCY